MKLFIKTYNKLIVDFEYKNNLKKFNNFIKPYY